MYSKKVIRSILWIECYALESIETLFLKKQMNSMLKKVKETYSMIIRKWYYKKLNWNCIYLWDKIKLRLLFWMFRVYNHWLMCIIYKYETT